MSFQNTDSLDTTGRREGFNDNQGGTESYGTGTGSGAYDPANTGLGGYGGQRSGAMSQSQNFGTGATGTTGSTAGGFDDDTTQSSGGNNLNWDRTAERRTGFQGDDSAFDNTTDTGRTFASGNDDFGSTGTTGTTGLGATGATGGTQSYRATGNLDEVNDQIDQTHEQGQRERSARGETGDNFDSGDQTQERQGGKPGFGDKMRGNFEKLAGSVTGNQDMKMRGQERKEGDLN